MLDNAQSIICAFGLASAAPRSPPHALQGKKAKIELFDKLNGSNRPAKID
ncbi:MAG: hypothetical protein PUF35_05035 [Subdoligranulum sp.]|nr:hypothetical protein [Subdoligranulum sp.]